MSGYRTINPMLGVTIVCPFKDIECRKPECSDGECQEMHKYNCMRLPHQHMREACEIVENLRSQRKTDREARLERAIREALKIIGSTQPRPYTALSRIDGILREGLR